MMRLTSSLLGVLMLFAPQAWRTTFDVEKSQLVASGASRYFILDPGYQLLLADGDERLLITVLDETRVVDGVTTRVVEERETKGGKLVEISRNFFARDPKSGDVFYFGEDVDMYTDGRVASHDGAWRSGIGGATFGLMLPGAPAVGQRYYQEVAPKVAMDRAEVVSTTATVKTPAGPFTNCVRVKETTPLEPGASEFKLHAPGIGLVQDGDLKLVRYGKNIERRETAK
jgi:hypothetical protein